MFETVIIAQMLSTGGEEVEALEQKLCPIAFTGKLW